MANHANGRLIDKGARGRLPPSSVDLGAINDPNRRERGGADGTQLDPLWDERTGDENCPLGNFLPGLRCLFHRRIGQHASGKRDNGDERNRICKYQRFHRESIDPARQLGKSQSFRRSDLKAFKRHGRFPRTSVRRLGQEDSVESDRHPARVVQGGVAGNSSRTSSSGARKQTDRWRRR